MDDSKKTNTIINQLEINEKEIEYIAQKTDELKGAIQIIIKPKREEPLATSANEKEEDAHCVILRPLQHQYYKLNDIKVAIEDMIKTIQL